MVAFVGLADVEQLDLAGSEPSLQLVDRHRLHTLAPTALGPACDVEDADGAQAVRGLHGLRLVSGVKDERFVGEDEG